MGARTFPPGFLHKKSTKIEVGEDDVEALGTQACREQESLDTEHILTWIGRAFDLARSRGIGLPLCQIKRICECPRVSAHHKACL